MGILLVWTQWLQPVRIDGDRMEPTVADGSFNLIDLRSYRNRPPGRGEVVAALKYSDDDKSLIVKRVIGLPGEMIGFTNGTLFINQNPEPEHYLTERGEWTTRSIRLRPDEYFIVGDNRTIPFPEHTAGAIELEYIIGKVVFP
jgi:signal peptidase I